MFLRYKYEEKFNDFKRDLKKKLSILGPKFEYLNHEHSIIHISYAIIAYPQGTIRNRENKKKQK